MRKHRGWAVGIEGEESLSDLGGLVNLVVAVAAHLPFGVAAHAVRVDGQELGVVVSGGPSNLSEGDLQAFRILDGVRAQ